MIGSKRYFKVSRGSYMKQEWVSGGGWKWDRDENVTVKSYYEAIARQIVKKALEDHKNFIEFPY